MDSADPIAAHPIAAHPIAAHPIAASSPRRDGRPDRSKDAPAGAAATQGPVGRRASRTTRDDIIAAAREEFAAKGFNAARMDDIAARTRTTKPAIYYHFGSKEDLFRIVLEEAYAGIRAAERQLDLEALSVTDVMRRLVEASFDYHANHADWVRLVSIENIHEARHITGSASIADARATVIGTLRRLLQRGEGQGDFRPGIDPMDLHLMISSLCFHRVSNRHTWAAIFGRDLGAATHAQAQRRMTVEAVLRYLKP